MSLYFDKVKLLQYEHRPILFEAGLRYKIEKRFTISGLLRDLSNASGVSEMVNKETMALSNAVDFEDIFLNDVYFGFGKITDVGFGGGNLVKSESISYSIACYEVGDLTNATTGVYAGVDWSNAHFINKLDEKFSFSTDTAGNQKYTHTVNISIDASAQSDSLFVLSNGELVLEGSVSGDSLFELDSNGDAQPSNSISDDNCFSLDGYGSIEPLGVVERANRINIAQIIAANLFSATTGIGQFLGTYTDPLTLRHVYSESYNLVDKSCSFSETTEIPATRSNNYSLTLKYDVKLDSQGFVTVSESGKIAAIATPLYSNAVSALNTIKSGSYTRSSAVYSSYGYSSATLFSSPVTQTTTVNKFTGEIDYVFTYSNNPKYYTLATWEKEMSIELDKQGYYQISENGTIKGIGRPYVDKLSNARTFFNNTAIPNVLSRVQSAYNTETSRGAALILVAQSDASDESNGTITYSKTYTDNNLFVLNSLIRKSEINVSFNNPVVITQQFSVLNEGTFLQYQNANTRAKTAVQIKLRGTRKTALSDYLAYAKNLAVTYYTGTDVIIKECKYSLNLSENDFNFNVAFEYTGNIKSFGDLTIT